MATTTLQELGFFGEKVVVQYCPCPQCGTEKSLKSLPQNFKCVDIACDFCGLLGQVKAKRVKDINTLPKRVLGATWKPQKERLEAGIFFPLFIVLLKNEEVSVFYLSANLQSPEMFVPRNPLSATAQQAGWQGFVYNMDKIPAGDVERLL